MVKNWYTKTGILFVVMASIALWPSVNNVPVGAFGSLFASRSDTPSVLSFEDSKHYQAIFSAQKDGNWKKADKIAKKLDSDLLMGHVLAERYLDPRYDANYTQLSGWLNKYNDLPQAHKVYTMALGKLSPAAGGAKLEPVQKQRILAGYGSESSHDARFTGANADAWQHGLALWSAGKYAAAAKSFKSLADKEKMTDWQSTASAYWAYRAFNAAGNKNEARKYLNKAAANNRTFYGILAHQKLHKPLNLTAEPIQLSDADVSDMQNEPSVRRTLALAQAGADELAEKELRYVFPAADQQQKLRLLALAHDLNMPSLQISMAKLMPKSQDLEFALYPTPKWQPEEGFKVAPELIFAMVRRESAFHTGAVSPVGAQGVMQIMPKTASMMQKNMGIAGDSAHANDPEHNIAIGQTYVQHLLEHRMVDNNLIYMLAAYNAGPARLQQWKVSLDKTDPLLFIESIPFAETRTYVKQVMTNYWIYSELSGAENTSVYAIASGKWPTYNADTRVASAAERGTRS